MRTSEFKHYDGCKRNDPDNCGACALTDTRQERPNYAAWPLAYMANYRAIPAKWKAAFFEECARTDNPAYTANIAAHVAQYGCFFMDGTIARVVNGKVVHGEAWTVWCRDDNTPDGEPGPYVRATSKVFAEKDSAIAYMNTLAPSRAPELRRMS